MTNIDHPGSAPPRRRLTRIALGIGLLAWSLHIGAIVYASLTWRESLGTVDRLPLEEFVSRLESATRVPSALHLCGNVVALAGLVVAAVATRREPFGIALGAAWIASALGLLVSGYVWTVVAQGPGLPGMGAA